MAWKILRIINKIKIQIIENKTVVSRLTITVDGCIRIKIAIGTNRKDKKLIIDKLTILSDKIIETKPKNTLRGTVRGLNFTGITMRDNHSKKHKLGGIRFSVAMNK